MKCDRLLISALALLIIVLVGTVPLSLRAQPDISVTVPEVKPAPGETVTLSIEADLDGEEVDAFSNMEFTFDDTVLDIVEVRDGSELSFGANNLTKNEDAGELRVSNTTSNPVSGSGEFLQIDVELTASLQNPGTPFRLTPSQPTGISTSVFEKGDTIFEISSIDQGAVGDLEIQSARDEGTSSTATVTGTVTRAYGKYVRFQDNSDNDSPSGLTVGPVGGDFKQDIADGNIAQGTRLYVRGTLSEPEGLLRVTGSALGRYTILNQGAPPTAQNVSLTTLQTSGGEYESELLRVDGLSFPEAGGTFDANSTYMVEDETSSLDYRVEGEDQTDLIGESIPAGTFTYEGVLGESSTGYQLVPVQPATALPVDLTGFTAVRSGSAVVLTWRTASETNNAGFRVQHRRAGEWQQVGFVPSKAGDGTTGQSQSYRFTVDRRLGPGTHWFRLEQVDLDQTTNVTDPVQIEVQMEGALHLSAPAPNPTSGRATFSFAVQEGTEAEVALYNVLGQRVRTLYEGRPPGEKARRVTVKTETLSSGVYVVRLHAGGETRTGRLTVVR